MIEVIGVRFKSVGKVYYFDPDGTQIPKGQSVIAARWPWATGRWTRRRLSIR